MSDHTQAEFEAAVERRLGSMALLLDLDAFQSMWLLHQAADAARRHFEDTALARFGLNWMQFEVLWHLWIFGEDEPRHISRAVGIPKSSLTAAATKLSERGFVDRRARADDARMAIFRITTKGSKFMTRVFPRVNHAETELTRGMTSTDTQVLVQLLRMVIANESGDLPATKTGPARDASASSSTSTAR